jgi:hypothetical protein
LIGIKVENSKNLLTLPPMRVVGVFVKVMRCIWRVGSFL